MHEEAKRKLADVPPENNFMMKNGKEVKNLGQLMKTLKEISAEIFAHHVNDDKNDFATWIRHSVGDAELADKLMTTRDLEKTKDIIADRISFLERRVDIGEILDRIESLSPLADQKSGVYKNKDVSSIAGAMPDETSGANLLSGTPEPKEIMFAVEHPPDLRSGGGGGAVERQESVESKDRDDEAFGVSHALIGGENMEQAGFTKKGSEIHLVEHFKRSLHMVIMDVLIGFVIGIISGFVLGYFVWS